MDSFTTLLYLSINGCLTSHRINRYYKLGLPQLCENFLPFVEDCDDMPCDPNADCWERPGPNNFTCECISPFVGNGFTCSK